MTEVPALTPVTTPELFTVATDVVALDQTPPVVASDNVVVEPIQTLVVPVIAATVGNGFIVTDIVSEQPT
jgi:hypothetical protein